MGWRKPAPQIFHHAAARLRVRRQDCVSVGDEPQRGVEGGAAAGMRPVLIGRDDVHAAYAGDRLRTLTELLESPA